MTTDKMLDLFFNLLKKDIEQFPETPSFNHSYWKGYIHAMEEVNGYKRNTLWTPLFRMACDYCDKLRGGKPVAGIANIK